MRRIDHYDGSDTPFEGTLTLTLHSLPAGACIQRARVRLEPVERENAAIPFAETLAFSSGRGDWGATLSGGSGWVEVNFHTRRTLAGVSGENLAGATLQVDMGGAYVEVNSRGTLLTAPGDEPFILPADGTLPPLTVTRFRLLNSGGTPAIHAVTIRSTLSNLRLQLGEHPPAWNRPGELTAPQSSPDLGTVLQALLAETAVEHGYHIVPLTLHSDTLGRVRMTVTIDYRMEAGWLPEGLPEVTLPFGHETIPDSETRVLQVTLPPDAEAVPGETRARFSGAFEETRIVDGPLGRVETPAEMPVTPVRSQAQPLAPERPLTASAVDLRLAAVTHSARLQLDLRGDLDGKPDANSLLPEPATFTLERTHAGDPSWITVPLPEAFLFEGGNRRYWLILQSEEGEAVWYAAPAPEGAPGMQSTDDGGLSWRSSETTGVEGALSGALRLRHRPERYQVPLVLEVGDGTAARRVTLDRFQPLGRVEFALDLPELAAAFNGYLRDLPAAACIEREHVADGGFRQWLYGEGDLSAPSEIKLPSQPARIAAPSRGDALYLALRHHDGTTSANVRTGLSRITPQGRLVTLVETITGEPAALAAGPDGWLYLVTEQSHASHCHRIDGESGRPAGAPTTVENGVVGAAVSPDGRLLYLLLQPPNGQEGKVLVYDAAARETPRFILTFPLGSKPLALAFGTGEAGPELLVLVDIGNKEGRLYRYETSRHAPLGEPLSFDGGVTDLAVAADGTTGAVSLTTGALQTIDLARWQKGSLIPLDGALASVRLSPHGTWAYVVEQGQPDRLRAVDLRRRRPGDPWETGGTVVGLALSADGHRLSCIVHPGNTLRVIELGTPLPMEWQVAEGHVGRAVLPPPFGPAAKLGDGDGPTILFQPVPLTPGCDNPWRFTFWGWASKPGASAELEWQDSRYTPLHTDRLPIQTPDRRPRTLTFLARPGRSPLWPHRLTVTPPTGATRVVVRFHVPEGHAVIDEVSLKVSTALTQNDTLQLDGNGIPFHWRPDTGDTGLQLQRAAPDQPLHITNIGDRAGSLVQEVPVTPGHTFRLTLQGRVITTAGARIGIRWKGAGEGLAGRPVTLAVEPGQLEGHGATGAVPDDARTAELFITLLPGATLLLDRLALRQFRPVTVPITPLAHAPGELTVTEARVTYDHRPPEPPPPSIDHPRPPAGASPGGTTVRTEAYCPSCRSITRLRMRLSAATPAGRPVDVGTCRRCGGIVILPGTGIARVPLHHVVRTLIRSKPLPGASADTGPRIPPPRNVTHPAGIAETLLRVKGIGPVRARLLRAAGISTVEKLAALQPARLEQILKNISPGQARDIIAAAKGR